MYPPTELLIDEIAVAEPDPAAADARQEGLDDLLAVDGLLELVRDQWSYEPPSKDRPIERVGSVRPAQDRAQRTDPCLLRLEIVG